MRPNRDLRGDRPWGYRLACLIGCLLVLIALHRVYVHAPAMARIARLQDRIAALELETRRRETDLVRVPRLEEELTRLHRRLEERITGIAHASDRPLLLARLSQLAQEAGLEILGFRPGEAVQRDGYSELPIQLELEGGFRDFGRFLNTLAHTPKLSSLGSLTITAPDGALAASALGISVQILTYALPETMHGYRTASRSFDQKVETLVHPKAGTPATAAGTWETLRDPFQPPDGCENPSNGLESYDLHELRLAGIVWEEHEPRALVIDGKDSGHIIRPGSRIGKRGGIVEAITPTQILVREHPAGPAPVTSLALSVFTFDSTHKKRGRTADGEHLHELQKERAVPPRPPCVTAH